MTNTFVFDTNCLVSASILPKSLSRQAFDKAVRLGPIASSQEVFEEYTQVLFRRKFDKYFISNEERLFIINLVATKLRVFSPTEIIEECRDPKDNKFLELAISAKASCIITGDRDLLVLHPFREIPVLNAVDFISHF
ncbi:MAG: putative toxin-antitoxin system toxin component, PIN family [Ginsengibacter sp.]